MMKRVSDSFLRLTAAALLLAVAASCDDDGTSGPSDTGNFASSTNAVVDSVLAGFFEDNESVNSVSGPLGGLIAGITGSPSIAPVDLTAVGDEVWTGRSSARTTRWLLDVARARASGTLYSANIPSGLLGVTCIWDPVDETYIADPEDDGLAPDNGIRFRLYTLDPTTLLPVSPLQDIGLVDIVDLSADPNLDVSITSEIGGVPVLDYDLTGTLDTGGFSLGMMGFVSDGTNQLDFGWSAAETSTSSSFSLSLSAASLDMSLDQTLDDSGLTTTMIAVSEATSGDELEIILGFNQQTLAVTAESGIFFNGEEVADFQSSGEGIALVPASGSSLGDQDLVALLDTLNIFAELFVGMEELFVFAVLVTGNTAG